MILVASLMLSASAIEPASLAFPALKNAPSMFSIYEQEQKFPEILNGHIVLHKGQKFMCGLAKSVQGHSGARRYVIALEVDWQIWEPEMDDQAWYGWNMTYEEICNAAG